MAETARRETDWRETDWPPARREEGVLIDRPRLVARVLPASAHTLVSGDLDAALSALAPGAPLLGLHAPAPEGAYALRIARDRALLRTSAPVGAAHAGGRWFATAVDDGWIAVDVEGAGAPSALAQGTSADLMAGSPSAAVFFAGLRCLLLRTDSGFRLHVEAPWLEALLDWLDGA